MEEMEVRWDKVEELIKPLREDRHMEEFAASGRYTFDEFYAAKLQTKPTNSIWGFVTLSYYLDLMRSFDKRRWEKYSRKEYPLILEDRN